MRERDAQRHGWTQPDGQKKPPGGGIGAIIRKHPIAWLLGARGVVFVLLGTGAVVAGVAVASAPVATPTAETTTAPPRPTPSVLPTASRLRTCSVAASR